MRKEKNKKKGKSRILEHAGVTTVIPAFSKYLYRHTLHVITHNPSVICILLSTICPWHLFHVHEYRCLFFLSFSSFFLHKYSLSIYCEQLTSPVPTMRRRKKGIECGFRKFTVWEREAGRTDKPILQNAFNAVKETGCVEEEDGITGANADQVFRLFWSSNSDVKIWKARKTAPGKSVSFQAKKKKATHRSLQK